MTLKNYLYRIFLISFFVCSFSLYSNASDIEVDDIIVDDIDYRILSESEATVEVANCTNPSLQEIDVPETISFNNKVYTVVSIGERAFSNLTFVRIRLPNSLLKIGDNAFYGCIFPTIEIPESVTYIGQGAFSHSSLVEIKIPDSVKEMGSSVFSFCNDLKQVVLSNSMESIPKSTFLECNSFENVVIPNSIKYIDNGAFLFCTSLTKIYLPNSVSELSGAFQGCSRALEFELDEDNTYFCFEDGILYNKEKTTIFTYPSAGKVVTIPDNVETIACAAFAFNKEINDVYLPESVVSIEVWAFLDATNFNRLYCSPLVPPEAVYKTFDEDYSHDRPEPLPRYVYVPRQSYSLYLHTYPWSDLNLIPMEFEPADVDTIMSDTEDSVVVYSIDGVKILDSSDRSDIDSLPAGLYIVNGKKILVK